MKKAMYGRQPGSLVDFEQICQEECDEFTLPKVVEGSYKRKDSTYIVLGSI